jgi:uncharacterized damage-inducible protein DinB
MPTPKELSLRALERTTKCLRESFEAFPSESWQEAPRSGTSSFADVLSHLYGVEHWWRLNIGCEDREDDATIGQRLAVCASADDLVALFDHARDGLLSLLAEKPDAFFENPVPTCHYGGLKTGADLCLYMGEHDFYHAGQVQMLEMAYSDDRGAKA